MTAQTLIFCIGAAKAGTSWLHEFLSKHEQCYMRNVKELHYFDALDNGGNLWHRKQLVNELERVKAKLAGLENPKANVFLTTKERDIAAWLATFDGETEMDQAYLDYIGYGRVQEPLVGDFTPAYALMSETMFAHMATLAKRVRFVFIMREPVDRLWSNIRMNASAKGEGALERITDSYLSGGDRNLTLRSNYRRTLNRLLAVLPQDALHIEFYERLFTPEAIERLCVFLGVSPKAADFGRVVHQGKQTNLGTDLRGRLQLSLKPQYNYVEKLMGGLPREWTDRMVST